MKTRALYLNPSTKWKVTENLEPGSKAAILYRINDYIFRHLYFN